jgi:hypothetical protein
MCLFTNSQGVYVYIYFKCVFSYKIYVGL